MDLKAELDPILQELKFVIATGDYFGYSYYPAKNSVWEVAHTKALLIEQLLDSSRYMNTWEFHGFSQEYGLKNVENQYFDDDIPEQKIQVVEEIEGEELWWQQYETEAYDNLENKNLYPNDYEYRDLEEFMFENLRDRRVYVLGNGSIYRIYIVGRTRKND